MIDPIELLQLPVVGEFTGGMPTTSFDVSTKFIYDNKVFLAVASDAGCIGCQVGKICPDILCHSKSGDEMAFKMWSEM